MIELKINNEVFNLPSTLEEVSFGDYNNKVLSILDNMSDEIRTKLIKHEELTPEEINTINKAHIENNITLVCNFIGKDKEWVLNQPSKVFETLLRHLSFLNDINKIEPKSTLIIDDEAYNVIDIEKITLGREVAIDGTQKDKDFISHFVCLLVKGDDYSNFNIDDKLVGRVKQLPTTEAYGVINYYNQKKKSLIKLTRIYSKYQKLRNHTQKK